LGRIVGVDYGQARIGLAITDERAIIAQPLTLIKASKNFDETAKEIFVFLTKYFPIDLIIVGLPLLLSGKAGPMAIEAEAFAKALEKVFSVPVKLWDERLTTAQAERSLREMEASRKKKKSTTDSMAAAAILQNYLESL
jgi:putative holliday junction resolvase